jgi:hypothetical protein
VQRQCQWLEYLKCNDVKIKVLKILQYEKIKHNLKERIFCQDFPPNEQIRVMRKLLLL